MLNESITTRASGIPPGALAKLAGETGGNRRQPVGGRVEPPARAIVTGKAAC